MIINPAIERISSCSVKASEAAVDEVGGGVGTAPVFGAGRGEQDGVVRHRVGGDEEEEESKLFTRVHVHACIIHGLQ